MKKKKTLAAVFSLFLYLRFFFRRCHVSSLHCAVGRGNLYCFYLQPVMTVMCKEPSSLRPMIAGLYRGQTSAMPFHFFLFFCGTFVEKTAGLTFVGRNLG